MTNHMQKKLSIFALMLMILACLGLAALHSLLASAPIVIALQTIAVGLMAWARMTFGIRSFHVAADPTSGGLVTRGPYKYIRHPIYTAACLFVCPAAVANGSDASITCGALLTLGIVLRVLCEESLLCRMYPEYREYSARTKRMVPYVF